MILSIHQSKNILLLFIGVILFFLMGQSAFASPPAGKVIFAKGEVVAIDNKGIERPLQKDNPILEGDTIITKKGYVQITFSDGGLISFYDHSEFKIDDYHYENKQDGNEKAFFTFTKGLFRTVLGKIGKVNRSRYQVKTNIATIGTRGTEYSANYGNALEIDVFQGTVVLTNQVGTFDILAGQSTTLPNATSIPKMRTHSKRSGKRPHHGPKKGQRGEKGSPPDGGGMGPHSGGQGIPGSGGATGPGGTNLGPGPNSGPGPAPIGSGEMNSLPLLPNSVGQNNGQITVANLLNGSVPLAPPPPPPPPLVP